MKYFLCEFKEGTCLSAETKVRDMVHELNQYFTHILGYSEILEARLEKANNKDAIVRVKIAVEKAVLCSRGISSAISLRENPRSLVIEADNMEQAIGRYLAAVEANLLGPDSVVAKEIGMVKVWDNE